METGQSGPSVPWQTVKGNKRYLIISSEWCHKILNQHQNVSFVLRPGYRKIKYKKCLIWRLLWSSLLQREVVNAGLMCIV